MRRFALIGPVVFVVIVGGLAVALQGPPAVVPATAPAEEFSAERAMAHVRVIASEPHPMASPQAVEVRDGLVRVLQWLGLETQIQKDETLAVENVIGVLKGAKPVGKAVMLAAHYDSVAQGPGAGDDAAGVAAILETLRALKSGPPLANDVIVVFTDGEEQGLLGGKVFSNHPEWTDRVGVVLNFEGRGNRGPSYMFETSERNGWLIRQMALAAPHPMATSLAYAVYQRMPNSTDLTMFKKAGLKGLNFAFVDGVENYHQPSDTASNLDPRSLQHHGSYALSLARRFGGIDVSAAASEPDAIYFHVMGSNLVVYAGSWVNPLTASAVLGFVGVVGLAMRRREVTAKELAIGIAMAMGLLLVTIGVAVGAWMLIAPWRTPVPGKNYRGSPAIAWGLGGLALSASLAAMGWSLRRVRAVPMALGGFFWWTMLTVASTVGLPGGSYLFLWPLVIGLAALALSLASPSARGPLAYLGALGALVLLPPTFQTLCTALGPSQPYAASPAAGLAVLAMVPLLAILVPRSARPDPSGTRVILAEDRRRESEPSKKSH